MCSFWCHSSIHTPFLSPMLFRCMMFKISSLICCPCPPSPPRPTVPSIKRAMSRRCGDERYTSVIVRVSFDCAAESSRGFTL